jgi:hypothetical protein
VRSGDAGVAEWPPGGVHATDRASERWKACTSVSSSRWLPGHPDRARQQRVCPETAHHDGSAAQPLLTVLCVVTYYSGVASLHCRIAEGQGPSQHTCCHADDCIQLGFCICMQILCACWCVSTIARCSCGWDVVTATPAHALVPFHLICEICDEIVVL